MCPLCLSTAAWVVAGLTSSGGVAVLAAGRRVAKFDKAEGASTPESLKRANRSKTKESVG